MIRDIRILVAAVMALTSLGAIGASGAQAAEFHCSSGPCTITIKPDGLVGSKTAHQVLVVKQGAVSVSTTCEQVTGDGTSATTTFNTLTLTSVMHHGCNVAGEAATVNTNGCEYHFVVGGVHHATAQVRCPLGKSMSIEVPATKCLITIGSTGVLGGGLTFKDAETGGVKKTEITAETTLTNIPATVNNKCPGGLKEGAATGELTTWNFELTGEEDNGTGKHANLWFE